MVIEDDESIVRIVPNAVLLNEVRRFIEEGRTVTLRVKGLSMLPFIVGARDSVQLIKSESYHKGDIVLAQCAKNHFVMHRIIDIMPHDGTAEITLMGDGNIRGTEYCRLENVIGRVSIIYRNNREIDPFCKREVWAWKIWFSLRPLRRWFLAIYRRAFLDKHWIDVFNAQKSSLNKNNNL